jgi:two-component system, LytTR family, response regulator AlgR
MSAQKLRIAIADDEAPARSRLRDLLEDIAGMLPLELAGEAATGRELLELVQAEPADVVLLDISACRKWTGWKSPGTSSSWRIRRM